MRDVIARSIILSIDRRSFRLRAPPELQKGGCSGRVLTYTGAELARENPLASYRGGKVMVSATALLLLVLGAHLASCEELGSRRSPVIRRARGVPTTGCYIVAMKNDASEEELQQAAAKASKASDDAKLHGLVQKVKKAFTVKLNPYALEMVREECQKG